MRNKRIGIRVFVMFTMLLTIWMSLSVSAKTVTYKRYWLLKSNGKLLDDTTNKYHYDLFSAAIRNVSDLKSSNKKVATAKITGQTGYQFITTTFKKPGKAVISFKGDYYQGNKVYKNCTFRFVHTVIRYTNPFKTLKIGKTNLVKLFNNKTQATRKLKSCAGKLKIVLKKGWKLQDITYLENEEADSRIIKNGKKIAFDGTGGSIDITLKNTTSKEEYSFRIWAP